METPTQINRRAFLVNTAAGVGGLVVAFHMPSPFSKLFAAEPAKAASMAPNAFIRIAPDNTITMVINRLEMGQGVNTSMAQLIAEELEVDWKDIKSVASNSDAVYNDPLFHMIMTGGSTSVAHSYDQYRTLGAGMREMLVQTAAKKWSVPAKDLKALKGHVIHPRKGKISYGELAEEANKLPFPEKPKLKEAKGHKVIGKSEKRLDAVAKSDGTAIFGMDVRLPGMLYATMSRPSVPTAKLVSYDLSAAKKIKGVMDAFKVGENKIAVVARNTHIARLGQEALNARWEDPLKTDTDKMMQSFRSLAEKKGPVAKSIGSIELPMKEAKQTIEAEFEFPFLAHAPMEPMNATVDFNGDTAEIYGGFQMPTMDHAAAAKTLGIAHEKVKVHITYAGGSFGRRGAKHSDWIIDACEVARVIKKPVKLVYTREDDMRSGYYRPMVFHKVKVAIDAKNILSAWKHNVVGLSISKGSPLEAFLINKDGVESVLTEGVSDTHYTIENMHFEQTIADAPINVLWWRSVGHTHTGFVMETIMDEVAHLTKQDPIAYRQLMLKKSPRHLKVLELLKKKAQWGTYKAPKGHALGMAIHESFGSVVGHIVEVSFEDSVPRVHKVWSAVHCGKVVNPAGAETQVEGAIAMAITKALYGEMTFKNGELQQENFDTYEILRLHQMPVVKVFFVETEEAPTGLGEPGVPPIAPAIANAIFRLNGKRLRKLPFSKELKPS